MEERVETVEVREPAAAGVGFVALSRFVVANGMEAEVKRAFGERPHLVDSAPGYVRMDVISPLDRPAEVWLITYWRDEESFRVWHRSHEYHESHRGMPKGLKLVPGSAEVRRFEYVSA
ncbi:MAG TPA: antibiotic biosynthesis monooxygenase [Pyrinomonadaceae bacterium]